MTESDGFLMDVKVNFARGCVRFQCPHSECRHMVVIPIAAKWYEGRQLGPIWEFEPSDFTLSPSIHTSPCEAHYFVRNGRAEFCSDHGREGKPL